MVLKIRQDQLIQLRTRHQSGLIKTWKTSKNWSKLVRTGRNRKYPRIGTKNDSLTILVFKTMPSSYFLFFTSKLSIFIYLFILISFPLHLSLFSLFLYRFTIATTTTTTHNQNHNPVTTTTKPTTTSNP